MRITNEFEISVKRFDEFALEYAEIFMNINSYQKHIDEFCKLINSSKPKVLELGCGPGNVTKYFKEKFKHSEILAIDLAPGMIDIAKKVVEKVEFRVMDIRDISTLELQFDSIIGSFCLPFLSKSDTHKLISDCSKQLVKGGVLYLSTMEGDEAKAGFEATNFSGNSKVYFNYHLLQDLKTALLNNGFSIVYDVRQEYIEPDGSLTIDLIMIAKKV